MERKNINLIFLTKNIFLVTSVFSTFSTKIDGMNCFKKIDEETKKIVNAQWLEWKKNKKEFVLKLFKKEEDNKYKSIENDIEIIVTNDKKIQLIEDSIKIDDPLNLKEKKYTLFKIITGENEGKQKDNEKLKYLYCSDIESFSQEKISQSEKYKIARGLFEKNDTLENVNIIASDTSGVINMSGMFSRCIKLKSISGLTNWQTQNVKDFSYMFENCSCLQQLDLETWNTTNVSNMCSMFYKNSVLQSLDLSGWNTRNVVDMSCMFCYCNNLNYLNLIICDTKKTNINSIFAGCRNLKKLNETLIRDYSNKNINDLSLFLNKTDLRKNQYRDLRKQFKSDFLFPCFNNIFFDNE